MSHPVTTHTESAAASTGRRQVSYWGVTGVLTLECIVGGVMGALRLEPFIGIIRHLGYPDYFMTILGVCYALAGLALLVPCFPRLKEWAYAGLLFNYTGAAASHLAVGDGLETLLAPIMFTILVAASWQLRPPARRFPRQRPLASTASRTVVYWITTALVAGELAVGGTWDLLRIPYVRTIMDHLGYPPYFLTIVGVWKLAGAAALLVPKLPRMKEWAYAGAVFTLMGAAVSHLATGDGMGAALVPIIFATVALASHGLRPPTRRDLTGPMSAVP